MKQITVPGKDFNLAHTFDCGQCFRWNRGDDGSYIGVAGGRVARLRESGGEIIIENCSDEDYAAFWRDYLDLSRDYGEIKKAVSVNDVMRSAVDYGYGIRLLRQEFFETLMSYIISQNNSIPNIKRVVERLCAAYGEPIEFEGHTYYSFPTPEKLAALEPEDFRALGAGFRDRYLSGAARLVHSGEMSFESLTAMSTTEARETLMKIKGVGNKVCDCVMLFSLGKYDLFPTDTWINKVMAEKFGTGSVKTAKSEGERLFGEYSGFAQQYLFYWRRELDKQVP
ncbi:MAG: DNA-3-methyladenine glycosylase 2 family protein [Oscillospiraceae bacterium]|nr:DNA-3-methyladenine glycosylase 2 family protein [Oscillospiraceae bacterium]